jgi:hypothetical protein
LRLLRGKDPVTPGLQADGIAGFENTVARRVDFDQRVLVDAVEENIGALGAPLPAGPIKIS